MVCSPASSADPSILKGNNYLKIAKIDRLGVWMSLYFLTYMTGNIAGWVTNII